MTSLAENCTSLTSAVISCTSNCSNDCECFRASRDHHVITTAAAWQNSGTPRPPLTFNRMKVAGLYIRFRHFNCMVNLTGGVTLK